MRIIPIKSIACHPLFLVIIATTTLRLLCLVQLVNEPLLQVPVVDANEYHQAAISWVEGDYVFRQLGAWYHGLFYPFIIGLLYSVGKASPVIVYIGQIVLGSLTTIATYFATKIIFQSRTAIVAAVLTGLQGTAMFLQCQVLPPSLILALDSVGIFFILLGLRQKSPWLACGAGLSFGLSAVTRANVLLPIALLVLGLGYGAWRKVWSWSIPMLVMIGPGLFLGLSAVRIKALTGEWGALQARGGFNFYYYNGPSQLEIAAIEPNRAFAALVDEPLRLGIVDQQAQSAYFMAKSLKWIRSNQFTYLKILSLRTMWLFAHDELCVSTPVADYRERVPLLGILLELFGIGSLAPFAFIGLVHSLNRTLRSWLILPSALISLGYLCSNVLVATGTRYRLPLWFALMPFTARGVIYAYQIIRKGMPGKSWVMILMLVGSQVIVRLLPVPHPFHTAFYEGLAFESQNRLELAEDRYQEAVIERPKSSSSWQALVRVTAQHRGREQALATVRQALDRLPHEVELLNEKGVLLRNLGQVEAAIESFKRASTLDPYYFTARINLANVYRAQKQYSMAEALCHEVLAVDPNNVHAKIMLAVALWESGKTMVAEQLYQELIASQATEPLVYLNYAMLLLAQERWTESVSILEKAVTLDPSLVMAWYNLGAARLQTGNATGAIKAWESCLSLAPRFEPARRSLENLRNRGNGGDEGQK